MNLHSLTSAKSVSKALELSQLPDFEKCFQLNVNAYELQEKGTVIPRFCSLCHYGSTLSLNMYENHLSFITNFNAYAKKNQCPSCELHFNRLNS